MSKTSWVGVAVAVLAACGGDEPKPVPVTFTTDLGVTVHTLSTFPQWTADDIDAAFEATTLDPIGAYRRVAGVNVTMAKLVAAPRPEVHFVADALELCGQEDVLETAEYSTREHGCYIRGTETTAPKLVVEVLEDDEIKWTQQRECIAVRTRIAHFAGHFAQEAMGLAYGHAAPLWSVRGDDVDIVTQRWLYRARCVGGAL